MLTKNRILLIGGTGLIGTNFLFKLLEFNRDVTICSRNAIIDTKNLNLLASPKIIQEHWSNINLSNFDSIYFLAGELGQFDSLKKDNDVIIKNELEMFKNFITSLKYSQTTNFVFISSAGSLYEDLPAGFSANEKYPISPRTTYGVIKYAKENIIKESLQSSNLRNCVILRVSNVYGGYLLKRHLKGVVASFYMSIIQSEDLYLKGKISNVRDFIHVNDLVSVLEILLIKRIGFKTLNVGSGIGSSIDYILNSIIEISNQSKTIKNSLKIQEMDYIGTNRNVLDIQSIRELLNWFPRIKLRDGLVSSFSEIKKLYNNQIR